ncbi:hypothetical protein GCM10010987_76550 [Bradyrhizobium guangdongense]|uniref:Uncharacterized protein n=1 Tax=Bradyrhizobium guangdongense TaxID=1325090 RepID=A0AA87WBQ7_9BRAD|nr:hypothetical protein GCM10010987_76550 [Bradyrhizobium guangdongense]
MQPDIRLLPQVALLSLSLLRTSRTSPLGLFKAGHSAPHWALWVRLKTLEAVTQQGVKMQP